MGILFLLDVLTRSENIKTYRGAIHLARATCRNGQYVSAPLYSRFYATGWRIASMSTFATSGRENSRGGISPACNIWRTFVPLNVTC